MSQKTYYLTSKKLKELKKEYEKLVLSEKGNFLNKEAPKMMESEELNPEFVSFQEDAESLRFRIEELENIFKNHEIIKKPSKESQSVVGMGAKVLVDINGKKDEFVILGTLEADPETGKISNESPVGQALLGKKIDEEIKISSPSKTVYKIKGIKYELS